MTLGGILASAQIVSLFQAQWDFACGNMRHHRLIGEPVCYSTGHISWAIKFLDPLSVEVLS